MQCSLRKYLREILKKFHFEQVHASENPLETNQNMVCAADKEESTRFDFSGALRMLMYLTTCSRSDLAYAMGKLSQFVANPTKHYVDC